MIRLWITIGLGMVLGLLAGSGVGWVRLAYYPSVADPLRSVGDAATSPEGSTDAKPSPICVVENRIYDFGVINDLSPVTHDFVFSNTGTVPLRLSGGESGCGCTSAEFPNPMIAPGATGRVTVRFDPTGRFGPVNETIVIKTNDVNWPGITLAVSARVTAAARAVPAEVTFSHVSSLEEVSAATHLWGYMPEPLTVTGYRLQESSVSDQFEVSWTPLSDEAVEDEADATSGYLVRITAKAGLPSGPFRQTIFLETDAKNYPAIEVVAKGMVAGAISVAGPGWSDKNGYLNIGTVNGRTGIEWTLLLVARGPHRKETRFTLVEVTPDALEVDEEALSHMTDDGALAQAKLKIRIPPGTPSINHLGTEQDKLGRIVIETNNPTEPKLVIYVRFAVEQ